MRFAVSPNDPRLVELVAVFDRDDSSAAETWRLVGDALERIGLPRPGYHRILRLVRLERRRRALRAEARGVLKDTLSRSAAGLAPNILWTIERVNELRREEALVVQHHEASATDGAEGD